MPLFNLFNYISLLIVFQSKVLNAYIPPKFIGPYKINLSYKRIILELSENDKDQIYVNKLLEGTEFEYADLDDVTKSEILANLSNNKPTDLEIRMNIMGINSWTIAGYCLAGIIILLNSTLGYGWASRLFFGE